MGVDERGGRGGDGRGREGKGDRLSDRRGERRCETKRREAGAGGGEEDDL